MAPEPALDSQVLKKKEIADIIAAANAAAEAEAARLAAAVPTAAEPPPKVVKKPKAPKKLQSKEEREANKEKRLLKLVGAVVVKCMSKYSGKMDNDVFKKYAKEVRSVFFLGLLVRFVFTYDPAQLTHIIAEKEKKSTSYKEGRLDTLSDEKVTKIKKFAKEYITKVLRKLDKSKSKPSSSSSSHHRSRDRDRSGHGPRGGLEPSGSVPSRSPDVHREGEDGDDGEDVEMVMSVEQAMDLGSDSEDGGPDDDADMDMDVQEQSSDEMENDPSPTEGVSSHVHPPASVSVTPITPPPQQLQIQTLDPRLKHRSEESGWDPDGIRVVNGLDEVHV